MASWGILTSLLHLLLLLIGFCHGEVVRTQCSGSTLNITCSKGIIVVGKVIYGQSDGCYFDSERCTHEPQQPHPCSGAYFCHWKVPILQLPKCGPSHYVQITYKCFIDGMEEDTWAPVLEGNLALHTTPFTPRFTEPQASIQERDDDYQEYYDVNGTSEDMSEKVLFLAKKNSPEKWATIAGGIIAGIAVILLLTIVIIMIVEKQRSKPEIPDPDYDDVTINDNPENCDNDGYENVNLGYEEDEVKETIPRYETITPQGQLTTQIPHIGETNTSDIEHQYTPNGSVYQNLPVALPNAVQISRPSTPRSPIHSTMLRLNYEDSVEPVLDWNSINTPITHLPNSIAHPADSHHIKRNTLITSSLPKNISRMPIPGSDFEADDVMMVDNDAYEDNPVAL